MGDYGEGMTARTGKGPELVPLSSAIAQADHDGDGYLSTSELNAAARCSNLEVDIIRKDNAAGSTEGVLAQRNLHAAGTVHVDGTSESHATGNMAPDSWTAQSHRSVLPQTPEQLVRAIMQQFDVNNDGTLDYREQMEMYKAVAQKLEIERKREAANRNYDSGAALRDELAMVRAKIVALDVAHERSRQTDQKKLFERAFTARLKDLDHTLAQHDTKVNQKVSVRQKLAGQKENLEHEMQVKELNMLPKPKPRYSKGLIEMRHTEMALASDHRYEEAKNVRSTTKVRELDEYNTLLDGFEARKDHLRSLMQNRHSFNQGRLDEAVKDMMFKKRRHRQSVNSQQLQCKRNHEQAMTHMLKMEMHKVMGTTHNIPLPQHRRPRTQTNASCRGTRLTEMYIGKRHLAIPSLSQKHSFTGPENFSLEEFKRKVIPKTEPTPAWFKDGNRGSFTARNAL